jgi:hypothetical protein
VDFLTGHPSGDPEFEATGAKFGEQVKRARDLLAEVETGERTSGGSRIRRKDLLRQFRKVPYRHLRGVVAVAAEEKAEVGTVFRPLKMEPTISGFRAWLQSLLELVEQHHEILARSGLKAGFADEVKATLAAWDQAVADANGGRQTHTNARRELRGLQRTISRLTKQLDGIMAYRLEQEPSLAGAWASARNVAWPKPATANDTPAGPDRAAA